MRSAAKNHVQLRLCRQTKCPTHIRLKAYLLKCLETSRQPWIRLRFDIIAESFGVTDRTLRRAKRRLEQDPDLKFRTLSRGRGSGWQVIVGQSAKLLWDKEPLFYKRWRDGMRSRNVKDRHCGHLLEGGLIGTGVRLPLPSSLEYRKNRDFDSSQSHESRTDSVLPQPRDHAADSKSASSANRGSVSESRCCRQREGFEHSLPLQAPDPHKPPACHAGEIERLPSKQNVTDEHSTSNLRVLGVITTSSSISGAAQPNDTEICNRTVVGFAKTSMVEQLTLNQLVVGSDQAVVTSENDDCVVPTYEYVCEKCATITSSIPHKPLLIGENQGLPDRRDSNPQSSQNELRDLNSSPPSPSHASRSRCTSPHTLTSWGDSKSRPPDPQSGALNKLRSPRATITSSIPAKPPEKQHNGVVVPLGFEGSHAPVKEHNDTPTHIIRHNEGRNRTGDKENGHMPKTPVKQHNVKTAHIIGHDQGNLTDSPLIRERRTRGTTAVKTRNLPCRDRIFACSGPELRRWATGKQLRLAYFEARSAIAWHRWDNCKVKAQPELLKSLWLAGLLAGYTPKQVEKAFAKALTVSHGLATDIGLLENNHRLQFEMSHTVAEAKRILTGVEPKNMYYTNKKC